MYNAPNRQAHFVGELRIESETDNETLAALVGRFGKAYTTYLHGQMEGCGTTPARSKLLSAVYRAGNIKMSEIGSELGVTPRNVTKLVDALESDGLLERLTHPSDRRVTLISLTQQGTQVAKTGILLSKQADEMFATLSGRDQADFKRVLARLLDELARRESRE